MKNNINIEGKFGDNLNDIKRVIFLAEDGSNISSIYVEYNNEKVEILDRNKNMDYQDFLRDISVFLNKLGVSNDDRDKKWFVTVRDNKWGIDFDELDKRYDNANMIKNIKNKQNYSSTPKKFNISMSYEEEIRYNVKLVKRLEE